MTDENKPAEAADELMTADEAEVRAILEARYPNDRRLQRALIRLAELRPDGRYGSMTDTADPAFQRIIPLAAGLGGGETTEGQDDTPAATPKAPGSKGLALKVEPLVTTSSASAGGSGGQKAEAAKPAPGAAKPAVTGKKSTGQQPN